MRPLHFPTFSASFLLIAATQAGLLAQNPDVRAKAIVSRMTLDEKIQEIHGVKSSKALARIVPGVPRLGIPPLRITNGPAGVGNGGPGHQGPATALPASMRRPVGVK